MSSCEIDRPPPEMVAWWERVASPGSPATAVWWERLDRAAKGRGQVGSRLMADWARDMLMVLAPGEGFTLELGDDGMAADPRTLHG